MHLTWELRKFGTVFDFMQNNALSRAELSNAESEIMNVHYGDILVKYGEILDVQSDDLTYLLDTSLAKKYQSSFLQNGDIIIADAAEDETVGKCSEIAGLTDEKVLSGLHTIPCRTKINFSNGFLGYYMNSNAYHDQLLPLMQGTKVLSISKSSIQETEVQYPKSEHEQLRIGDFFKEIDHLITLHQREYEYLFGEEILESKGMTNDWEQRKLGEVVDVQSGRDYKHLDEGDIPVYGTGGYMLSVNQALSYEQDAIGIGRKGTIDKPYVLKAPFWTVDTLFYALPCENNKLDFLHCVFQNTDWKKKDESTGVPSLSKTTINEVDILVPKEDEQEELGQFFVNLDNLITLHQRKP